MAKLHTKSTMIMIAHGKANNLPDRLDQKEIDEIKANFRTLLNLPDGHDLSKVKADELLSVFEAESLLERFAAKKANKLGKNNDFLAIKGDLKG